MEQIANEKKPSLYSPSYGMIAHAEQIKESNTLQAGESERLRNIHLQSTAENMYVGYAIYRRVVDSTYCILVVRSNGEFVYYGEV
jgi:hypothetical protein